MTDNIDADARLLGDIDRMGRMMDNERTWERCENCQRLRSSVVNDLCQACFMTLATGRQREDARSQHADAASPSSIDPSEFVEAKRPAFELLIRPDPIVVAAVANIDSEFADTIDDDCDTCAAGRDHTGRCCQDATGQQVQLPEQELVEHPCTGDPASCKRCESGCDENVLADGTVVENVRDVQPPTVVKRRRWWLLGLRR